MKTIAIQAHARKELGKKSTKAIRANQQVPCVMYGGEENIHFFAHENTFKKIVFTNQVFLVELDVDGKAYKAVMKDIQFHPVSDEIIHIDFVQVFDDKPATVALPIVLTGNSKGIRAGGKLRQARRYLKVKGLIADIPEVLSIDITKVGIGGVIKVSNLKYPNLELLDPAQAMVVGVVASRLSAKGGTADEEDEEETSGEATETTEPTSEA